MKELIRDFFRTPEMLVFMFFVLVIIVLSVCRWSEM